jgi:fructoselysine and glucoselysine-specific PTS system IID component
MKTSNPSKKLTKKDLLSVFWRSLSYNASFNYERQLNVGWCYSLMPVLRKLYGDKPEEMKKALKRHLEFNNITPYICTVLFGITTAMEEQNANLENFDTNSINAVKVGLMGPLSGIGDSIFFGTLRVIAAGVGCSLAAVGNVFGPILYILMFNIPNLLSRYFLMFAGYNFGTSFMEKVEKTGVLSKLFEGAAILGLMVIGAMVSSLVKVPLNVKICGADLLKISDSIFPNLLPLLVTILMYFLLKKNVNVIYLLLGIIIVCIACAGIGIF